MILKDSEWRVYIRYSADIAQDDYDKKAEDKGLNLKIGNDYNLAAHIENKILNERFSPDAVIMESNSGKHEFEISICTRTLYNYIDKDLFVNITTKDLPRKGEAPKDTYRRVRTGFQQPKYFQTA